MKRVLLALVLLLNWNVSAQEANGLKVYWVDVEGGAATFRAVEAIAGNRLLLRILAGRQWSSSTPARRMPARLRIAAANLSAEAVTEVLRTPGSIRKIAAKTAAERDAAPPI